MKEKIKELLNNEEICAEVLKCDTVEKVVAVFQKNGVEISSEEIALLKEDGDAIIEKYKNSNEELDLEMLEDVAGGSKFWRGVGAVAGGVVLGAGMAVVCSAFPGATPGAYKAAVIYGGAAAYWVNNG